MWDLGSPLAAPVQQLRGERGHYRRAIDLDNAGDQSAEREYRLAIQTNCGRVPEIWEKFSFFLARTLRFAEAADAMEKCIRETAGGSLTWDKETLRKFRKAAELQQSVGSTGSPKLEDLTQLAYLVSGYGRNKTADALPYAQMATHLYPNSSTAYLLLGQMLRGSGDREQQLQAFEKAIDLDPTNDEAYAEIGFYYLYGAEAIRAFRKSLEISGGSNVQAWLGLGRALLHANQLEEGIDTLRTFLKLASADDHSRTNVRTQMRSYARLLEQQKKSKQSVP